MGQWKATRSGNQGEQKVKDMLNTLSREYFIFNNVLLKTFNGSTQIDHVIVSPYGIFVIETKNHKGMIFGNDISPVWTQTLINRPNYTMYNPVKQNFGHIRNLSKQLDIPESYFRCCIVFTSENVNLMNVQSQYAGTLETLANYIISFNRRVISDEQVRFIVSKLNELNISSKYRDNKHKDYVNSIKKPRFLWF